MNATQKTKLSLPAGATNWQTKKKKAPFIAELEEMKKAFLGSSIETKGSSIYVPLCQAIEELNSDSTHKEKVLIIVSDMIENSKWGNFYKDKPFETIKKKLDESKLSIPKAENLKVIIIFDPKGDTKKYDQFEQAMKYWRQLFAEKNINYETKTNL